VGLTNSNDLMKKIKLITFFNKSSKVIWMQSQNQKP